MPVAAACAVAAHKLGKQVRLTYNRNTDFRQNGGGLVCLSVAKPPWQCRTTKVPSWCDVVQVINLYVVDVNFQCKVVLSDTAKHRVQSAQCIAAWKAL